MAFVNERLTQQQREVFLKRKIRRPSSDNYACPIFRTIDTERNMCLWNLGNFGRDDFNDHKFLFEWNGNEYFIIMKYFDPDPNSNVINWSISKFEKTFNGKEDYANDFKNALIAYAIDGSNLQHDEMIVDVELRRM